MEIFEDKEQIKRVFFHELGHYFAFILSGCDVESIILNVSSDNKYLEGATTPRIPEDYIDDSKVPIQRLPYYITNQVFGCTFQNAFYTNDLSLICCMNCFGANDRDKLVYHCGDNKVSDYMERILDIFEKYKIKLEEETKYNPIRTFPDIELLFDKNEEQININLEQLKVETSNIIKIIEKDYNEIILKINELFDNVRIKK